MNVKLQPESDSFSSRRRLQFHHFLLRPVSGESRQRFEPINKYSDQNLENKRTGPN